MPTFRHESGIPVLTGNPERDIAGLRNALYGLEEELRYMFNNLDTDNLGMGLSTYLSETLADAAKSLKVEIDVDGIVAEVRKEIGGDYTELSTKVQLTADGLSSVSARLTTLENNKETEYESLRSEFRQVASEVSAAVYAEKISTSLNGYATETYVANKISVSESGISASVSETLKSYATNSSVSTIENKLQASIEANANAIALRVTSQELNNTLGSYSTTTQMNAAINASASGITSTVEKTYATKASVTDVSNNLANNYYGKSVIDQKFNAIKLSVNVSGKEVSLTLNGETQKISLSGYVSFTNLSNSGETAINGGNITTGTISASRLDLSGVAKISSLKDGTTEINGGCIKTGTIAAARLDLSGVATIAGLQNGTTTINGGCITTGSINANLITTGTLSASRVNGGTLSGVTISGNTITGGTISGTTITGSTINGGTMKSETTQSDGLTTAVQISDGAITGIKYNPSTLLQNAKAFYLDYTGLSLMNLESGLKTASITMENGYLRIDSYGYVDINADLYVNGLNVGGKAFPGGYSLSDFSNNGISMATAYTNNAGTSGGADVSMGNITEKDSAGVFSRSRYSSSYGYGILCSKAGYYLISAHAVLSNKVATEQSNTIAIRKVVGGTSTYIVRNSLVASAGSASGIVYTQDISPMLVYLEANSYLSMYVSNSNFVTTNQGCYISAVYLGI